MRQAAKRNLSPQFQEIVGLTTQPFFQPVYDLETTRMAIGRVAIIGDAAFVVRPHVGAGVTKAAQDALSLVVNLRGADGDVLSGLLSFEQDRLAVGARIVAQARHLGAYMNAQRETPEERRDAETYRQPDAVMRETASLAFLRS
jgi:2-polyprenyl-6-methoxyphenol hydroxylase-like FAD-dependent oxidoreductase